MTVLKQLATGFLVGSLAGILVACGSDDSGDGADSTPAAVDGSGLEPLPNPPLSEAPAIDDEPIADDPVFHTAVSFDVVREPGQASPLIQAETFTENDFALGLPEPVLETPSGLDPALNQAPFFEGLENQRLAAGETLELRYVPQDPEGELPGMFPQELPPGASFDDNLDGTKTLRWLPLQADVGITAFTVVAVDPGDPRYRVSQTVLIAVDPPVDPAAIPNVPPELVAVAPIVARVGDPVVFELEGFDRNGTMPSIELPDLPAGASLEPHSRLPDRQVLRFVPTIAGQLSIEVLLRDADDATLTSQDQLTLTVAEEGDFDRPGNRLRVLAAERDLRFGFAASPSFFRRPDGALYESIASQEFDIVTPESAMKMDTINPEPGRYQFAETDNLMAFARASDMSVRGHPLVWHRQLPDWIEATQPEDREVHMREFINRVMSRYADDVEYWDVVNEPLDEDGSLRRSVWSEAMDEEYIDVAFRQARLLDPSAILVLNEFDAGVDGPKADALVALLDRLRERDVPIDAVGFQMHLFASFDQFEQLSTNLAEIAARDYDIHITELDVSLTDETGLDEQADVYQQIVSICVEQPRCRVIQTWGLTDRYSFRSLFDPLPLDRDYLPKPAYTAVQNGLIGE